MVKAELIAQPLFRHFVSLSLGISLRVKQRIADFKKCNHVVLKTTLTVPDPVTCAVTEVGDSESLAFLSLGTGGHLAPLVLPATGLHHVRAGAEALVQALAAIEARLTVAGVRHCLTPLARVAEEVKGKDGM